MKKKRKVDEEKHIPDNKEIEEETNYDVNVREMKNVTPGQVDFPDVEDDMNAVDFKGDVAQQIGRFSDQVLMGSPAAEAGTVGRDALKDTVKAARKKLKEKVNNQDKDQGGRAT